MQIRKSDLVVSSSVQRIRPAVASAAGLVPLTWGVYAPSAVLGVHQKAWVARQRVAEARLLAVQSRLRADAVFTGESALVASGLRPWWNNPDIHLRRKSYSGGSFSMPSVQLPNVGVPGVVVRQFCGSVGSLDPVTAVDGAVRVAPDPVVILDLAARCHPLQAFHDVSLLIRHAVNFDRRDLARSRERAGAYKGTVAAQLRELNEVVRHSRPPKSSTRAVPGLARALSILDAADPGVESPAESVALWALKCILPRGVKVETQRPFVAGGRHRNVDLALPQYRAAIEATGYGKYGDTSASAHHVAQAAVLRQQDLEDLGWTVINVTYDQVKRPLQLMDYLTDRLARVGVVVTPPRGPLFAPLTPLLFHPSRRF